MDARVELNRVSIFCLPSCSRLDIFYFRNAGSLLCIWLHPSPSPPVGRLPRVDYQVLNQEP